MSAEVLITAENWPNWYLMLTQCRANWSGQEELRFAWRSPEPCLSALPWEPLRARGREGCVVLALWGLQEDLRDPEEERKQLEGKRREGISDTSAQGSALRPQAFSSW